MVELWQAPLAQGGQRRTQSKPPLPAHQQFVAGPPMSKGLVQMLSIPGLPKATGGGVDFNADGEN